MVSIVQEIDALADLADLVEGVASLNIEKQETPKKPNDNTLVIKWVGDQGENESGAIYELNRLYQLVYYSESELSCIDIADKLRKVVNDTVKLKISESEAHMTLGLLAWSAPHKTEHKMYAIVGILPTSVFIKRTQPTYEKIMHFHVSVNGGESE